MEPSSLPLLKHVITIGNSAKDLADQPGVSEWILFVDDKGGVVKSVNFVLHPTFNPPSVTVDKTPFSITRQGWGTFECTIAVTFIDSTRKSYTHKLVFDNTIHSKDYKVDVVPIHEYTESKKTLLLPLSCYTTKVHSDWKAQGGSLKLASSSDSGMSDHIELINWGAWLKGNLEDRKKIGLQIAGALAKTGFFLIENHGVSSNLIDKTMNYSKSFFSMKLAEKKKN